MTVVEMQTTLCGWLVLANCTFPALLFMHGEVVLRLHTVHGTDSGSLLFDRRLCMPVLGAVLPMARLTTRICFATGIIKIKKHTKIGPAIGARCSVLWSILKCLRHPNTIAMAMLLPVEMPALPKLIVPEPFVTRASPLEPSTVGSVNAVTKACKFES